MRKKRITLVVAYSIPGRVIGKDNKIPWRLSADMQHFKDLTTGHIVIMGRKTFESFDEKFRPLPNRINVIVTRNKEYRPQPTNEQTFIITSLFNALEWALSQNQEIFIIGGGEIYGQALNELKAVDSIIATEIHDVTIKGDTYFSTMLDPKFWNREELKHVAVDEKNSQSFIIVKYTKK